MISASSFSTRTVAVLEIPRRMHSKHFYIAYRAVVRAKVDCVRFAQGHAEASTDARRHIDIALDHLRAGTVQLIVIGGGPGTGKTTLSRGLAEQSGAEVISTDEVRRELEQTGVIAGAIGVLDSGLYAPENVNVVYDEVLRRARMLLGRGVSVILDGTWRDPVQPCPRPPVGRPNAFADRGTYLHRTSRRGLGENREQACDDLRCDT